MKRLAFEFKDIIDFVKHGTQMVFETGYFWFQRINSTTYSLITDAFALNVARGIADFKWEEGELDMEQYAAKPKKVPVPASMPMKSVEHTSQEPVPFKKKAIRFFLKPVKKVLRFIVIDLPEQWSSKRKHPGKEMPDPYENRVRSGN